jgi:myo-inositol-hexaphosphate 3-phosphohydrolase
VSEGCVADDENAYLFVAEEGEGIWRYGAEPGAGSARVLVDTTGGAGHLAADVEGLGIYYAAGGAGYLVASSQGDNSFVVYERRPPHERRLTFQIAANAGLGIDAVSETDGIDVTSVGLGSAFPSGLFVAQDGSNPGANQNFKFVPWQDIAELADPPLLGAASGAGGGDGGGGGCSLARGRDGRPHGGDSSLVLTIAAVLAVLAVRRSRVRGASCSRRPAL